MSKFKPGDVVIQDGAYTGYTSGSAYNIPVLPLEVKEAGDSYIIVYVRGGESPPLNDKFFELCEYKAKPLKRGTLYLNVRSIGTYGEAWGSESIARGRFFDHIAIVEVPWVEGQGLG